MKLTIRELICMPLDRITDPAMDGIHEVVYDDGTLTTDSHVMALDNIIYGVLRPYIGTQWEPANFNRDISIKSLKYVTANSITDLISNVSALVRLTDPYNDDHIDRVNELAYYVVNQLYNFMCDRQEYVFSFCFIDMVRMLNDPDIKGYNDNLHLLHDDMEQAVLIAQAEVEKIIMHKNITGYKGEPNNISLAVRNRLAPLRQVIQLLTAVGKRSDIDGTIMHRAIPNGYGGQMRDVADLLIDSRTAAMALYFQKDPLQQTEYLNRRIQLVAQYVRTAQGIDCGNDRSIERMVLPTDKNCIVGKWMRLDDGTSKVITADMVGSLVGTKVKLRSVLHCMNKNRQTKCKKCIGHLSINIPNKTNLGQNTGITIGSENAQNTLAVKHSVVSSVTGDIHVVGPTALRYLSANPDKNSISFSNQLSMRRKIILKIKPVATASRDPISEKGELLDFVNNYNEEIANDITRINPFDICSFNEITIAITDSSGNLIAEEDLYVKTGSRSASFSIDALKHMVAKPGRIEIEDKGGISIDFSKFGHDKKLFVYRKKVDSLLDYSASLREIIISEGNSNNYRGFGLIHINKFDEPEDAVNYLCDFLNLKNTTNILHAEIIVSALLCKDPSNGNYNFPDPGQRGYIVQYDEIMKNRSMGSGMAWEQHGLIINLISNYLKSSNPYEVLSHPLDELLMS